MSYYGINEIPDDRVLVYEVDTDPLSLDPACCADYIGQIIIQALYEPLFVRNVETGDWQLGAAERFEVSPDRLTYTFYLAKDKRWSDGQPVVAEDFVFALRRVVAPETNSPFRVNLAPLLHADEIGEGLLPASELGVAALEEATLQIQLAYPIPYLEGLLGMYAASPLPNHRLGEETLFTVGNGPFCLVQHVPGQSVQLRTNPGYGAETEESVAGIRFQINRDLNGSLDLYRANEVHITCNTYFPFERIGEAKGCADFYQEPSCILFLLQFNQQRHTAFQDRRLRAALYHAIDKTEVVRQLQGGLLPWDHFVPKGIWQEEWELGMESPGDWRDLANAPRQPDGTDLLPLTVLYADFFPNREVLDLIQEMWQERLGVVLQFEGVSFEEFVRRAQQGEYDLCLRLLAPSYSEPLGYFLYYLPELAEGIDDLVIEQLERAVNEPGQRGTAYQEADRLLRKELPLLPLFNGYSLYFVKPTLHGYRMFSDGSVCFRNLVWVPVNDSEEGSETA